MPAARTPVLVFAAAQLAYFVAVAQRSSLGVASVAAGEQFHTTATQLAMLGVAQVAVYAALQVPVGMLLDRFGPSRLIVVGAVTMSVGQAIVALAPDLGLAIAGRMLVGCGDATTYVSGLRLLGSWFPPRRVPVMTQSYAAVGQLGQVFSAVPFAWLLHAASWLPAFASLAGLSVFTAIVVTVVLRDSPAGSTARPVSIRQSLASLRAAVRHRGTQLGFWTHFTTQFSMTAFSLLWGYPLMVQGLGLEPGVASALLSLVVLSSLPAGPVLGVLTGRFPLRRSDMVLAVCLLILALWLTFLLWPGQPPLWLLVVLVISLGLGGAASNIGFDFARTSNPPERFGAASGFVNVGGFTAAFTTMFVIGVVLDAVSPGALERGMDAYRAAFWVVVVLQAAGIAIILRLRRGETRGEVVRTSS